MTDTLYDKEYVEASVQTEVANAFSNTVGRPPSDSPDTSSTSMHSCIEHSSTSPQVMFSFDGKVDRTSPQASIQMTERSLKRRQLVPRRPAGSQTLKSASARIVSLPETAPDYSEKKIMQRTETRVVSMPSISLANSQLSDSFSIEHYIGDLEAPARIRVHSTVTEATHTPSPPSSPDSVVFIANRSPLPPGFLRGGRPKRDAPALSDNEDEGEDWSSWSNSPPRPIPALHGPLSLPYARCPSGAEGTIIEEPENLPRMIWGLDGDSEATDRTRPDPKRDHPALSQTSTHKSQTRPAINYQVPPRFHNKSHEEVGPLDCPHTFTPVFLPPRTRAARITQTLPAIKPRKRDPAVPEHGPIDLTELVKPPQETPTFLPALGASGNPGFGPYGLDQRVFTSDMDMDWQNLLLMQDRLGHSVPDSFGSRGGDLNYLRDHGFTSPPLVPNLMSSRSPIVLDPPSYLPQYPRNASSQYSPLSSIDTPMTQYTPTSSHDVPGRMSALEIAQKYRQQQMLQQPNPSMLPTPPSSSSPIWSSGFSPQESLWSPELAASLPWSDNYTQRGFDHTSLRPDAFAEMRRTQNGQHGQGRPPVQVLPQSQPALTHPTNSRESHTSFKNSPLSQNYHFLDSRLLDAMNRLAVSQPPVRSPQTSQTVLLQRSPAQPQPPPNTPYTSSTSSQNKTETPTVHGLATPPTPASPNPRVRSISHQHPRSIPLARLVQRRLSSVPEEELSVISEHPAPHLHGQRGQLSSSVSAPEGLNSVSEKKVHHHEKAFAPPSQPASAVDDLHAANAGQNSDLGAKDIGRNPRGGRGRGRGRGGRRARGKDTGHVANGPERVDGGITVRS